VVVVSEGWKRACVGECNVADELWGVLKEGRCELGGGCVYGRGRSHTIPSLGTGVKPVGEEGEGVMVGVGHVGR